MPRRARWDAMPIWSPGDAIISPSVTRTLLSHGSGASNAEVAASLYMSEATVKAHVSHLFTKLDCSNRVQIAIMVHDADQS